MVSPLEDVRGEKICFFVIWIYVLSNKFIDLFFSPSCDEDGNDHTELDLPTYPNPSTPLAEQKLTLTNVPTSLAVQFSAHRAAGFAASAEPLDTPCAASPRCTVHCSPLQERNDLEISVLRRQEAVLKLQEEYYTLKIKQIKKQMEEPIPKD